MKLRNLPLLLAMSASIASVTAQASTPGNLNFVGRVNAGTCNLTAADENRTVTLPTVKVSDFDNANAIGLTGFEITSECDSDIRNVTFLFTGTADSEVPAAFANTGTAKGMGLRIRAGTPTDLQVMYASGSPSQRSRTIATAANRAILSVEAAYQKNHTPISQGTLVSTATVSITYN